MYNRIPRINQLLKKEIGEIILREIGFEGALITVTRVETSSKLNDASVYISAIPDEKIDNVFKVLNRNIYNIQKMINRRLRIRPVPKIRFVREPLTKEAEKIEEILEEIKEDDRS